jgi:Ni,Fe-hydrogenase III small subunit
MDEDSPHAAATVLFIDGAPALGGLRDRLKLARHLVRGGGDPSVSVAVAVTGAVPDARETLTAFLAAQGDMAQRARAWRRAEPNALP